MSRVGGKDMTPELVVRRAAHALGLRFRLHRKGLPGTPDLVFPRHKAAVFVHGCFWHRHEACRSEEHTSELQSLMRISYAVFCLKKKTTNTYKHIQINNN